MKNVKIIGLLALGLLGTDSVKANKNPLNKDKRIIMRNGQKSRLSELKMNQNVLSNPKKAANSGVKETEKTTKLRQMQDDAFDKHDIAKKEVADAFDRAYNNAKKSGSSDDMAHNSGYEAARTSYDRSLKQQGATEEQRNFLRSFSIR